MLRALLLPLMPALCTSPAFATHSCVRLHLAGGEEDGEASDDETLGAGAGAGSGVGAGEGTSVLLTADPSLFLADDVDGLSDLDDDDDDYEEGDDDDDDDDEDEDG